MTFEEWWKEHNKYLTPEQLQLAEMLTKGSCICAHTNGEKEGYDRGFAEGLRRAEMLASNAVERCREYNCGSFAVSASKAIADAIRREREGLK